MYRTRTGKTDYLLEAKQPLAGAPAAAAVDTAAGAACLLDDEGTILESNAAFDRLLAVSNRSHINTPLTDYLSPPSQIDLRLVRAQHQHRPGVEFRLRLTFAAENGTTTSYFFRSSMDQIGTERYQLLRVLAPASRKPGEIAPSNGLHDLSWSSHLDVIRDITSAITSASEPKELYPRIHKAIARVIPADVLLIGVIPDSDSGQQAPAAVAVYCAEGDTVLDTDTWSLSPTFQVVMHSRAVRVFNEIPDGLFSEKDRFGDPEKRVQSLLCAPLIVDDDLVGLIVCQSYSFDAYRDEHARLLDAIGRSIAVAVQRSQLLAGLRNRIDRESRIREMISFISGTLDVSEVLDRTVHAIFEFVPNRFTAIAVTDANGELRSRRRYAYDREALETFLPPLGSPVHPKSLIQRAFDRGKLTYVPDIGNSDSATLEALYERGVRSAAAVPIPQQSGSRGAIFVARNSVDGFDSEDLELLQTISGLLGAWLRHAELYNQTTTYARDLEDIQRISRIVASDLDVERTLAELIELVPHMLDAEGCSVRVIDGEDFLLAAAAGSTARSFPERIPVRETEGRDMVHTHEPVFKRDLHTDPATRDNAREKGILARGWASAPLIDEHGAVFGALSVHTAEPRDWTERDRTILLALATAASQAYRNARAFETTRNVLRASIESLSAAVDAKDPATLNHSRRVARIARAISQAINLAQPDVDEIELAALLHDIGKIGIPDRILQKPGALDEREWNVMRLHPGIGEQILGGNPNLAPILPLVRHHHERWDGQGYPDGIAGDAIPVGAAIIAVAEAFETLTSDRSYSERRTWEDALAEIRTHRGTQFAPAAVDALHTAVESHRITPQALGAKIGSPGLFSDLFSTIEQSETHVDARSLVVFHRVAQAIREITELENFATRITDILEEALDEHVITVYLLNEDRNLLIPYGKPGILPDHRVRPGRGIVGKVAQDGEPIHVADASRDPNYVHSQFNEPGSEVAVPIKIDGQVIGVLNAESSRTHAFSERDEALLMSTAALLARTIQTARLHDELQRMSRVDALTGLANHRAFYEVLEEALEVAQSSGTTLSLVIMDLNKLKAINDSYGHLVGDEALRRVAQILQHGSRPHDVVCRYGGDEFAMILKDTESEVAHQVMRRLQRVIAGQTITVQGATIQLPTGAWGIASYPQDGDRPAALVAMADQRMYDSKPR